LRRHCHSSSASIGGSAIDRSPVFVLESTTRSRFSIRSTSDHLSLCISAQRMPVRTTVRNTTRACSSSKLRRIACTSSGFNACPRHFRFLGT
jgi:hypothetical protein